MDIFYAVLAFLAVVCLFLLAAGICSMATALCELFEALTGNDSKKIPVIGLAYYKDQVFKVELKDTESESNED